MFQSPPLPTSPQPQVAASPSKNVSFYEPSKDPEAIAIEKAKRKPLLTKAAVCRLLAELVKSYGSCAKIITDHVYDSATIKFPSLADFMLREETTALAYLFDDLLISKNPGGLFFTFTNF